MDNRGNEREDERGEEEVPSGFDALEARLAALRAKVLRGLPGRASELDAESLRLERGGEEARAELQRLGHKLRGVAGSYGLDALGALAAELEALARDPSHARGSVVAKARELAQRAREAAPPPDEEASSPPSPPRSVEPAQAAIAAPAPSAKAPLEGLHVLGADDDDATRRLLSLTFIQMGRMRGTVFESGQALIEALRGEASVDLVVVDAMMPEMNGAEVLRAISDQGLGGRVLRFVVLSAASPEELGWSLPPEIRVDWLRKPFRPKELLESLVTLLAGSA